MILIEILFCSILMTEAYGSLNEMIGYYGKVENGGIIKNGSHIPFNFNLLNMPPWAKSSEIQMLIDSWINKMPKGKGIEPNWVVCIVWFIFQPNHEIQLYVRNC